MAIGPFGLARIGIQSSPGEVRSGLPLEQVKRLTGNRPTANEPPLVTPLDVVPTTSIELLTRPIGTRRMSELLTRARLVKAG
jgi:hypothetical protein